MALWECRQCTTTFAVGLSRCPQCTGVDVAEVEDMPKISVHKGPTNAGAVDPDAAAPDLNEGGESSSDGNSSATSSEKPPTSDEQNETDPQQPAPTTEPRSSKGRKGRSTARSTGTSGPGTGGE